MLLKTPSRWLLATPGARESFASLLTDILQAGNHLDEVPYRPNGDRDDTFWTLDSGNDWKVVFYPDQPNLFRLTYRYNHPTNDHEAALAGWLVARYDMVIVGESIS